MGRGPASRADGRGPQLDVPEGVTADQLDPEARAELRALPPQMANVIARWLVAASQEPDPERGYQYALQARQLAARIGVVRETCGVAAYRAGRWAEALAELRTARRLTGRVSYLPMMADSERALGRLDRALAIIRDPEVGTLDRATQIELLIVESGIRRDEGRPTAAAAILQVPELTDGRVRDWSARLAYAYADALLEDGREDEAREWFGRAAALDTEGDTDAAERIDDLDSIEIDDLVEPDDGEPGDPAEPDDLLAEAGDGEPGGDPAEPGDLLAEAEDGEPGGDPAEPGDLLAEAGDGDPGEDPAEPGDRLAKAGSGGPATPGGEPADADDDASADDPAGPGGEPAEGLPAPARGPEFEPVDTDEDW